MYIFMHYKKSKNSLYLSSCVSQTLTQPCLFQVYHMEFLVEDPVHGQVGANAVAANVTVTVHKIPEIAVRKSGSVRLDVR